MENFSQGQLIYNRYLLKELVGRGGFSEVWRATDQMTQETVALKIFNNSEGVEEYKQTAELKHSNILTPKFIGVHHPNTPFLVLPFCDRGTAQTKIGKLDQEELAQLIFQIADALSFVHERTIIHNDVKPDNFLISSDLNKSKYFLSDFGISDQRNSYKTQSLASQADKQEPRGIIPTPYRAPELIDHEGNHTDKKAVLNTDIWAFGASIYELVVGRPPFGNQGGLAQIMALNQGKHEVKNILTEWPDQVSSSLFDLVKRCLDYTPWKRPDAAELRDAAKLFLEKGIWNVKDKFKPKPKPIKPEISNPIVVNRPGPIPPIIPVKVKSNGIRAWIIVLGALILLALVAMVSISASKYKGLVKEGDALLANRDTAAALVKYKAAVGINLYATAELKGKIDSLEHPVDLVIDDNGQKDPKPENKSTPNTPIDKPITKSKTEKEKDPETENTKLEPSTNTLEELPNVSFIASEDLIYTGQPIVFTDNTKIPTGFRRRNYEWDFGDGVKSRGTIPNEIQHSYSKPGVYVVKLCYNNGSVCSKPFSIKVESEEPSFSSKASAGLKLIEKSKCADPVFEEGVFSVTLKTGVSISLSSIIVLANTGGSVTISLLESGEVLTITRKRVAQSNAGTTLVLTNFPVLDANKTYTLQLRTEGAKLQNIASCSPDLENKDTPQLDIDYNANRYVIFDLRYNY